MARITTAVDGRIGTLVIDNPDRRNAMNVEMYRAVPTAVEELLAAGVRAIIVRGAGREAFGAGSDISEFPARRFGGQAAAYDAAEHAAWTALGAIPVPVIAAIHGPCMGGGIAIALHTDVRLAADDATFAVPPARLGLAYPREALVRLVELVGPAHAKLLLYSGRVIDAGAARAMGLVQEVVAKGELDDHAADLASRIAGLAPLTHRATKLSIDALSDPTLAADAALAREECYDSEDFREGVHAFLDKRRPNFNGR